jgi:hypothetical protein
MVTVVFTVLSSLFLPSSFKAIMHSDPIRKVIRMHFLDPKSHVGVMIVTEN